ncbi:MAG: MerR family transcriptional regulator [Coriobacteriia bacterium]|nr:MerR family transcriptional regulator [Coriobacteriia bacterium]
MAQQATVRISAMPQESAQGKTYTIATLLNVLDISRGTLRYYEQIGLVRPGRDPETGYRSYSNDDVFRVAACYMLKNAGFSVQDAQTLISKIHDAPELIDMLWHENERQRVWHETMCKTLSVLRKLCDAKAPRNRRRTQIASRPQA